MVTIKKTKYTPRTQPTPETRCAPGISWEIHNKVSNLARPTESLKPNNVATPADSPKPTKVATEKKVGILISNWSYVSDVIRLETNKNQYEELIRKDVISLKLTENEYERLVKIKSLSDALIYLRMLAPEHTRGIDIAVFSRRASTGMVVIRVKSDGTFEDNGTIWHMPKAWTSDTVTQVPIRPRMD